MTRLYLVRHGRAAAGWSTDRDPGLDEIGHGQAVAVAARLRPFGPLHIETSPFQRCRETASPLATAWGVTACVDQRIAEIPSPEGVAMSDRVEWLKHAMNGTWNELGVRYTAFRDAVAAACRSRQGDSVLFTHFIAINAAIGAATGDDRVVIRRLDNCSVTVIDVIDGVLHLVEGGHEADTLIR
ncbi:MAG: 2,3-bisphosphoglycerate-dependent phosphoglycerate mutase [Acidimicrobiaceae bacterium]|nr:MAG: 2,3-bisphosphoglycerate-dependent phosphoglycerate mutase [Acidimicrobiaceae bacterium]